MTDRDIRADLQAAGRWMIAQGLTWGNAGNISARTTPDAFLITASGTRLGELAPDDLVEVPVARNAVATPTRKPSKELPMHRAIYAARPEIDVVLHAEPLNATLVACTDLEIPANWFISGMYYLERVARVPYFHPGSEALGAAVEEKARIANVLLLEHHGVLVYDTSMKEAMMGLETLEVACKMMLLARSAGLTVTGLPPHIVTDFLDNAGYKPRRKWPS
jgi:ribulose-5-phosphate 4-epimerase/fuculose-1-phosphate aldolase